MTHKPPACEFCGDQAAICAYPARPVESIATLGDTEITLAKGGAWLACGDCASLIDRTKRDALIDRVMLHALRRNEAPDAMTNEEIERVSAAVRAVHDSFWAAREGEPRELSWAERIGGVEC